MVHGFPLQCMNKYVLEVTKNTIDYQGVNNGAVKSSDINNIITHTFVQL
jgi:hypothetical protein